MLSKNQHFIINGLLGASLLVISVFIVWVSGHNLNFDDEGFYTLPFISNQAVEIMPVQQYSYILEFMFPDQWISVFNLRIFRLLLILTGGLYLGHASYHYLKTIDKKCNYYTLLFLIPLLALSNFVFGPLALSYNSASFASLLFILGGVLSAYSSANKNWHLLISGAFIVFAYYAKFTTGILILGTVLVSILIIRESFSFKKQRLIYLIIGVFITALIFHFIYPISDVLSDGLALSKFSDAGYDIWSQLEKPKDLIVDSYKYVLIGLAVSVTALFTKNIWLVSALGGGLIALVYHYDWVYVKHIKGMPIYFVLFGMILIQLLLTAKKIVDRKASSVHFMLLPILILCGVFGTNNHWILAISFYTLFLVLTTAYVAYNSRLKGVVVLVVFFTAANTIYFTYQPYRSPKPLEANKTIGNKKLGPVKVSDKHLAIYNQFETIIQDNELSSEEYLGILWKYPMVNFLFDIPSPAGVIWSSEQKKLIQYNYEHRQRQEGRVHWIAIYDKEMADPTAEVVEITDDPSFIVKKHYIFGAQHWYYIAK